MKTISIAATTLNDPPHLPYKVYFQAIEGEPDWEKFRIDRTEVEEIKVLDFLIARAENGTPWIQKFELIAALNDMGSHDEFESKRQRTSMRKLQQILRDLTLMGFLIVRHPKHGVKLAQNTEEVREYANWLEQKAKADIKSMMLVRRTLLQNAGIPEDKSQSLFPNF